MSIQRVTLDIEYTITAQAGSTASTGHIDAIMTSTRYAAMERDEKWLNETAVKCVARRLSVDPRRVNVESVRAVRFTNVV